MEVERQEGRRIHCYCTGKAPSQPIHKQFLLLLELLQTCLSRQEKPSQSLLGWGIYAVTHKHGAQEYNIKHHPNAVALSIPVTLLQAQLCHTGGTRGHAGQQNIKGSKLFSDYFVYCASGFWLDGVAILSSLPRAVKAAKMFVLDGCSGKSAVLGLLLYQVCQIPCYMWHTFFFFLSLSSLPVIHNISSKSAKNASSKANRKQANKFLQNYLASCFRKGLQMEQESALAFIANHNATDIPHEKNLSQAKDFHGRLKEAIYSWKVILFTARQKLSDRAH